MIKNYNLKFAKKGMISEAKIRKIIRDILKEAEIDPEGNIIGLDNKSIGLSSSEMDKAFFDLVDKFKAEGRIIGYGIKEFWFPIEARELIELIGVSWGHVDKATNREHPDFGKTFFVVEYGDVKRKK